MIKKVTLEQLNELLSGTWVPFTSAYRYPDWKEKLTVGKITLSIKKGKKRKLLNGTIKEIDYLSSQTSSGMLELKFIPNSENKLKELVGTP